MANFSTGNTQRRREAVKYQGFQFEDFLNGLIDERNLFKQDIANLTKNSRKTITEWTTGLSIPTPANFQNVLNVLAPTTSAEERNRYISTNTNIYESIREQYLIAKKNFNLKNKGR